MHALASLHPTPSGLAGFEHVPVVGLQMPASWHWFSAVQVTGFAPTQSPFRQESERVQASSSVHAAPSGLAGVEQVPVLGSQVPATWHWSSAVHVTVDVGLPQLPHSHDSTR